VDFVFVQIIILSVFPASFLSQYKYGREKNAPPLCSLVLDTGYSFSHIVPYFRGKKMSQAVKR
jgi:actin-related protein 6